MTKPPRYVEFATMRAWDRLNWCLITMVFVLVVRGRATGEGPDAVDFNRDIRPIFNRHCLQCHGGVKQSAGLSFIYRDKALSDGESGMPAIKPGDPDGSYLIYKVTADDEERMPPVDHGPPLAEEEIARLRAWIAAGAPWAEHWAFVPPQPQALPDVANAEWCMGRIDRFILARLNREGLAPSAEGDRADLLRRVTFDLTGLPPTPEELRSFLQDQSPEAYNRVVDRLLASPAFGERWAAMWLDLARFADTQGYERDFFRVMWPYRDWVIQAFNADMPFDEFTIKQLAGDLLQNPSLEDQIATAFHRCSQTNAEGGTDDEEFRLVAVMDRVNTTWEVWQGVPFKCAQCHSHPYAPIEQHDYYRFLAAFNKTKDWDLTEDVPTLAVPLDGAHFQRARAIDRRLEALCKAEVDETHALVESTPWQMLEPIEVTSTGMTQLELHRGEDGATEIWTAGTVSHDSKFTLDFAAPGGAARIAALRIDVLPRDPASARLTPELGFVVSEVQAFLVHGEPGTPSDAAESGAAPGNDAFAETNRQVVPVPLRYGLGDEILPFGTGQQSLEPDAEGWGAEPRITCPRRLVIVPAQPIELSAGARLRLVIRQEDAPHDMMPLVMGRSKYSFSGDGAWERLAQDAAFKARRGEMTALQDERKGMPSVPLVVMAEQDPCLQRATAVFLRGNWLNKGDVVTTGLPRVFGLLGDEGEPDRLRVARWLVSKSNPLTGRVAVNRFWEQLFGTGIVETLEDFGPSGQPPFHAELLDELALRFQHEQGWSMKRLVREVVLSSTYRQIARVPAELVARDPRNRLLARGPRSRLTAEMVRDNALAVSGLLQRRFFGPSVMPPQPEGLGQPPYNGMEWVHATGEDRYRRAVYTFLRRSNVYPGMVTFDAPNRIVCAARRVTTNTPLQALATLNDVVYIECASALAERMLTHDAEPPGAIEYGYELVTGRRLDTDGLGVLLSLYSQALHAYEEDEELAAKLGDTPREAAMVVVANALLNLDVTLTK